MARQYAVPGSSLAGFLNETGTRTEALGGTFVHETTVINTNVAPGAGSITLTGFAPTVVSNTVVSPGVGSSIVFTGFAPTINSDSAVAPGAGSIVFIGFAPAVTADVAPGAGAITLTGYAPVPIALATSANLLFRSVF